MAAFVVVAVLLLAGGAVVVLSRPPSAEEPSTWRSFDLRTSAYTATLTDSQPIASFGISDFRGPFLLDLLGPYVRVWLSVNGELVTAATVHQLRYQYPFESGANGSLSMDLVLARTEASAVASVEIWMTARIDAPPAPYRSANVEPGPFGVGHSGYGMDAARAASPDAGNATVVGDWTLPADPSNPCECQTNANAWLTLTVEAPDDVPYAASVVIRGPDDDVFFASAIGPAVLHWHYLARTDFSFAVNVSELPARESVRVVVESPY